MRKIIEAFIWFSTVVAICAVTVVAIFVMREYAPEDGFSVWAGAFIMLLTIVAGLYWGSICLGKTAEAFKESQEEKLKGDEFDF